MVGWSELYKYLYRSLPLIGLGLTKDFSTKLLMTSFLVHYC